MNVSILVKAVTPQTNMSHKLQPFVFRYPINRILLFFMTVAALNAHSQTATNIVIVTQPVIGAGNGALMSVQPVVEIRDASNQKVTTSTAQVEIVISSGNGGTLGGTTRINAVNGTATFTDLTFSGIDNEPYVFGFKSEPVIAYEPFAYTADTLTGKNGGTGWSGAWFDANPAFTDLVVNTTGFTYTNFATSGGRASYTSSTGGDGGRMLAAVSNATYSVVWLSFLANYDQQGGGFNNVRMYLPGSLSGGVGGNAGVTNWSILNNTLNAGASTTIPLNGTTRLALLKIDYTAGTSSLWIDPVVSTFDGTQTPSMTETFAPVFDRIELYNRTTSIGTDELTLTSTYKAALHLEQNLTSALSNAVLPLKWVYFTASCEGDHSLLKWGTTNEHNNSHFIVERKTDASAWLVIGKVQGTGNDGSDQEYQFSDSAFPSKTYYRLRQVDFDNKSELSKVVTVSCKPGVDGLIRVFPNPVGDRLTITGAQQGSGYMLMNAQGHTVKTGIILSGSTTISLSDLPAGSYFLKLNGFNAKPVHILRLRK